MSEHQIQIHVVWLLSLWALAGRLCDKDQNLTNSLKYVFNISSISIYQSTLFQLCRDGSSWFESVLSKDKCVLLKDTTQWRRWGSNPRPLGLESSTLLLSHCAHLIHVANNKGARQIAQMRCLICVLVVRMLHAPLLHLYNAKVRRRRQTM